MTSSLQLLPVTPSLPPPIHNPKEMVSRQDQLQPHFVLIPLMAQGHMIPMINMARLFASRGVAITFITTPVNASRFKTVIGRAVQSGFPIRLIELQFPSRQVGLPDGCENVDLVSSPELVDGFFAGLDLLQEPVEQFLERHCPRPSCIISDMCLPWTSETARKLGIPRIVFHGPSAFSTLCIHILAECKVHESISSDSEPFLIPGLPQQIEITKAQLPQHMAISGLQNFITKTRESERLAYGCVINSFNELEHDYVEMYRNVTRKKVWAVGPVSLCNKNTVDMAERGNKAAVHEKKILSWLDSKKPNSVVYVCFGSLSLLKPWHLREIGLGLEASGRPFVWVIRGSSEDLAIVEKWLVEGFEERVKNRGLIIRGWAPQILILSHPSTGGFLTHCGWNSTLEGISAGVPMIICPLFADQFLNAKLVEQILRTGVSLPIEAQAKWWGAEEIQVLVKMEEVKKAVENLMDEGEEGEERRKRASELGKKARMAMEEGGSSYRNITLFIEDVVEYATKKLLPIDIL